MTSQRQYNIRNSAYAGGAPVDGVTDSWPAIQAAIAAALTASPYANQYYGATVYFPYCRAGYYISQPITVTRAFGLSLIADPGTILTYGGSATAAGIIQIEGDSNRVSGFHIQGTCDYGIRMRQVTVASTWITTRCMIDRCEFTGSFTSNVSIDIRGGTATGNNEYHRVQRCTFRDYGKRGTIGAGVHVYGGQSHANLIRWNKFYGDDRTSTKYGVYAEYGAHQHVHENYFEANRRDIYLNDFLQTFSIKGNTSRYSSRFTIISGGATASSMPGEISNNDIDAGAFLGSGDTFGNPYATITSNTPGPIRVMCNKLTATNANPMIRSAGLEAESRMAFEFGGNVFKGPANYYAALTNVTSPIVMKWQAGMDFADSFIRYANDHGTNRYYNISTGKYELITCQGAILPGGLSSADATVMPRNWGGYSDFAAGGAQSNLISLTNTEADTNYRPRVVSVEALTGTPPDNVVAYIESGKSTTGMNIKISAAPVGWGVRVFWNMVRAA